MPDRVIIPNTPENQDVVVVHHEGQCFEFVGNTNDPLTDLGTTDPTNNNFNNCSACQANIPLANLAYVNSDPEVSGFALNGQCDDEHSLFIPSDVVTADPFTIPVLCGGQEGQLLDAGPSWITGLFGNALDMTDDFPLTTLNGNRAEFEGQNFAELHGASGEFTYEALLKFSSTNVSHFTTPRQILSMDNGNIQWYLVNESGSIVMKLSNTSTSVTRTIPITGQHSINTSDWFAAAAVFNSTVGKIQLYWTKNPETNQEFPSILGSAASFTGHDGFVDQKVIFGNREGADENFIGLMEAMGISDVARCPKKVLLAPPLEDNTIKLDEICGCYEFNETIAGNTVKTSSRTPIMTYASLDACLNPSPTPTVSSPSQTVAEATSATSPSIAVAEATSATSPSIAVAEVVPAVITPSPSPASNLPPVPDTGLPSPSPDIISSSPASRVYQQITSPSVAAQVGLCCGVECPGGDPNMHLTVSGVTWPDFGLEVGVHCLCPSSYSLGATTETWQYDTGNFSDSGIRFSVGPGTSQGIINVNYNSDTTSFTAGVTGRVQDRLFTVYTAGGLTATFQRGCDW